MFDFQNFCIFFTDSIDVFHMMLAINIDNFPKVNESIFVTETMLTVRWELNFYIWFKLTWVSTGLNLFETG
jgi:hypothetical protein